MKNDFYTLDEIKKRHAIYNVIFGKRSRGKTTAILREGLQRNLDGLGTMAYIRRFREDFRGKRGASLFDNLVNLGWIAEMTGGEWTDVFYYSGRWWLCRHEGDDIIKADEPFCTAFALSEMQHDKSSAFPDITFIFFDEFLSAGTGGGYLPDEFVLFMNTLSTIIRHRDNVVIYMAGNSITQYCPYFAEMGLSHIKQQREGTIDLYQYGENGETTVAVEFTDLPATKSKSDKYFAFDNPRLQMIHGEGGSWQLDIYPHAPDKWKSTDVVFVFFILWQGDIFQCDIVSEENREFIYIHRKSGEIKNRDEDCIYSPDPDPRANWHRDLTRARTPTEKAITRFFASNKVFYQDNMIGDAVNQYIDYCAKQ